jgi:hypothetical protein
MCHSGSHNTWRDNNSTNTICQRALIDHRCAADNNWMMQSARCLLACLLLYFVTEASAFWYLEDWNNATTASDEVTNVTNMDSITPKHFTYLWRLYHKELESFESAVEIFESAALHWLHNIIVENKVDDKIVVQSLSLVVSQGTDVLSFLRNNFVGEKAHRLQTVRHFHFFQQTTVKALIPNSPSVS